MSIIHVSSPEEWQSRTWPSLPVCDHPLASPGIAGGQLGSFRANNICQMFALMAGEGPPRVKTPGLTVYIFIAFRVLKMA